MLFRLWRMPAVSRTVRTTKFYLNEITWISSLPERYKSKHPELWPLEHAQEVNSQQTPSLKKYQGPHIPGFQTDTSQAYQENSRYIRTQGCYDLLGPRSWTCKGPTQFWLLVTPFGPRLKFNANPQPGIRFMLNQCTLADGSMGRTRQNSFALWPITTNMLRRPWNLLAAW